jgi:hypothetical protein
MKDGSFGFRVKRSQRRPPVKNYQKLYFSRYYAQDKNGEYVPVARSECFAPPEELPDNPYPQRWFYDAEAGYAVRLARTAEGDALGKRNNADLKAEERRWARENQCVGIHDARCPAGCEGCPYRDGCDAPERLEDGKGCKRKCDCCDRFERRILELDRPAATGEEDADAYIDIADTVDVAKIATDSAVLELLLLAVEEMTPEEKALFNATFVNRRTVRDYGAEIHVSHQMVSKRMKKLREKLLGLIGVSE